MAGKAQLEPADALHLIDLGVEVPDVVVALVRVDAVFSRSTRGFLTNSSIGGETGTGFEKLRHFN